MSRLSNTIISATAVIILSLAFAGGFFFGQNYQPSGDSGPDVINQAWGILSSQYVDKGRLDSANMTRGAIEGIIDTLDDPYTAYFPPDIYQQIIMSSQRQYAGIGAVVSLQEENVVIMYAYPNSPAAKAGLGQGDSILEINGESVTGLSLEIAASKIRGPAGTTVNLKVLRAGETEAEELEITRDIIELPSVYYEVIQDVAYIGIVQFTERTNDELIDAIKNLKEDNAKGIILDLRDDGGGLLDAAIAVASHFLDSGIVATTRDNEGNVTEYWVDTNALRTDLPMVVLVNENTASASEIVTGALQDHERATVSGNTTYGKGSANIVFDLNDGSALNVTIARWYTPNGRLIEGQGITPDIKLEQTGEAALQWAIDYLLGQSSA